MIFWFLTLFSSLLFIDGAPQNYYANYPYYQYQSGTPTSYNGIQAPQQFLGLNPTPSKSGGLWYGAPGNRVCLLCPAFGTGGRRMWRMNGSDANGIFCLFVLSMSLVNLHTYCDGNVQIVSCIYFDYLAQWNNSASKWTCTMYRVAHKKITTLFVND